MIGHGYPLADEGPERLLSSVSLYILFPVDTTSITDRITNKQNLEAGHFLVAWFSPLCPAGGRSVPRLDPTSD